MKQTHPWSCFADSFALVAKCETQEIIDFVGYRGDEIIFDNVKHNRQGFALNHLIAFMLTKGYSVTPVNLEYYQGPNEEPYPVKKYTLPELFLEQCMSQYSGVLVGSHHAVAWDVDRFVILDPIGYEYPLENLFIKVECFFLCSMLPKPVSCSKL